MQSSKGDRLDSHDPFAGDVLATNIDEDIIEQDDLPDLTKFGAFAFTSNKDYEISQHIEDNHFSTKTDHRKSE